ncbi:hypothetical protein HK405_010652 [Cladochytrium tenue]|nr:hypothetical protein HK405_010652 [Cladochytrium tenue]
MFLARDTPAAAAAVRLGSAATQAQQAVETPANVVFAAKACVHGTATQPHLRDPSLESPLLRLQRTPSSSFFVPGWPHDALAQPKTSLPGAFTGVSTRHQTPEAVYSTGAHPGVPPAPASCMPPPPPPPPRSSATSHGGASRWDLSGSVLASGYKIGDDAGRAGQSDATYRFVDGLRSFEPDCPVHSHLSTSAHEKALRIPLLGSPLLAADGAGVSVGQRAGQTSIDHAANLRGALCGSKRQGSSPTAGNKNAGRSPAQTSWSHAGTDRDSPSHNFLEPQDIGSTSLIQPGSEAWVYHSQGSDSGRPSLFFDSHHTPYAHVDNIASNSILTPADPARVGQDYYPSAAARQQPSPTVSLAAVSDMRRPREDEAENSAPPATRRRTERSAADRPTISVPAAPAPVSGAPVPRAARAAATAPKLGTAEAHDRIKLALLTIRFALAQNSKDNGGPRTLRV